jgi:hypothetical protein
MDSDAMHMQQHESTPITTDKTSSLNGIDSSNKIINVDDEDEQAAFLNYCIEQERIDFEKSAEDKRNANIIGKYFFSK